MQVACEAADKKPRRKGKWRQAKVGPEKSEKSEKYQVFSISKAFGFWIVFLVSEFQAVFDISWIQLQILCPKFSRETKRNPGQIGKELVGDADFLF